MGLGQYTAGPISTKFVQTSTPTQGRYLTRYDPGNPTPNPRVPQAPRPINRYLWRKNFTKNFQMGDLIS